MAWSEGRRAAWVKPLKSDAIPERVVLMAVDHEVMFGDQAVATGIAAALVRYRPERPTPNAMSPIQEFGRGYEAWEWVAAQSRPGRPVRVLLAGVQAASPSALVLSGLSLWAANAGWSAPEDAPLIATRKSVHLPLEAPDGRSLNVLAWGQMFVREPVGTAGERVEQMIDALVESRRLRVKYGLGSERAVSTAQQSYNSVRRGLEEKVWLAHDDAERLHIERVAYRGGLIAGSRDEHIGDAWLVDVNGAYLSVARHHHYPLKPAGAKTNTSGWQGIEGLEHLRDHCAVAAVALRQDIPAFYETRPSTDATAKELWGSDHDKQLAWKNYRQEDVPLPLDLLDDLIARGPTVCQPLLDSPDRDEYESPRPTGRLILCVLTSRELAFARESPDIHIRRMGRIWWYHAAPFLREWAGVMEELRAEVGDGPLKPWAKQMAALLHGKLARRAVLWAPEPWAPTVPLGSYGFFNGLKTRTVHDTTYARFPQLEELQWSQPGMAAHLTADCRVGLLRRMAQVEAGGGTIHYCHTDGFLTDAAGVRVLEGLGRLGGEVGQWKIEGHTGVHLVNGGWYSDTERHVAGENDSGVEWHQWCGMLTDVATGTPK